MNTKQRLAQRLESLGAHGLAEHARKGLYSDFESEVATPKVLLLAYLRVLGLHEMVQEVMNGEWDDSAEEAEAWAAAHTGGDARDGRIDKGEQSEEKSGP